MSAAARGRLFVQAGVRPVRTSWLPRSAQYLQSFGGFGQNRGYGHSLDYAKWAVLGKSDRKGGICIPDCGLLDH